MIRQLLEPCARTYSEGAQVHRVNYIFASDDRMNSHRHHQWPQFTNLFDETTFDLFELVAARSLSIHRQLEIASKGRNETHGQIHGISNLVIHPQTFECDSV